MNEGLNVKLGGTKRITKKKYKKSNRKKKKKKEEESFLHEVTHKNEKKKKRHHTETSSSKIQRYCIPISSLPRSLQTRVSFQCLPVIFEF